MFSLKIHPRFGDIDGLGHVNNTVPAVWFEMGRTEVLRMFDPDLTLDKNVFPLIIAHIDFDFVDQMFFNGEIEIKTWISKIGTKSFTISHEAWQDNRLCVKGSAVIVYFDFIKQETTPIPQDKRNLLEAHLITE